LHSKSLNTNWVASVVERSKTVKIENLTVKNCLVICVLSVPIVYFLGYFFTTQSHLIFKNSILLSATAFCIISIAPFYYFLNKPRFEIISAKDVSTFFVLWILVFLLEYYIFGPFSFIEMVAEGNLNISLDYYLSHGHGGERFSHAIAGGQDLYVILPGKQYLNPELLLMHLFPAWIVILIHKFYVGALGFFGSYLLARHVAPGERAIAVAVAAIFPVTHLYLLNFSTNWGPGFACLPLAAYTCVACSSKINYYGPIIFTAIITMLADPIHIFPALLVTVIAAAILLDGVNLKKVALGFLILVFLSILNWHEVLFAHFIVVGATDRSGSDVIEASKAVIPAFERALGRLTFLWISTWPFILAMMVFFFRNDRFAIRAFAALVWVILSYTFVESFRWDWVGLGFLNTLSNQFMLLIPFATVTVIVTARMLTHFERGPDDGCIFRLRPKILLLAAALSILTWNKFLNFGSLIWFGGQSSYFGYENLQNPNWKPLEDFRVITLFESPSPNLIPAFYGLESYDGQWNLNYQPWLEYWNEVGRDAPERELLTRSGLDWRFWDGTAYDISAHLRLDLLRIANVRYLLSPLPLKSSDLKLVFKPGKEDIPKAHKNSFRSTADFIKFRVQRIFNPGNLYIYELPRSLPRVFAARNIEIVSDNITPADLYNKITATALRRTLVVTKKHASDIATLDTLELNSYQKVLDGYRISVVAPEGGVLVLNNVYLPFWEAHANGKSLKTIPVNGIHTAVILPPGTQEVDVRYNRPLLRETVSKLFN
jgi:hypothetical protein